MLRVSARGGKISSMKSITLFTDGSSRGNPGPGGWGAIVVFGDQVTELGAGERLTTNNRMELSAAIGALSRVDALMAENAGEVPEITIYTDSRYVINGATKWIFGWKKNGWISSSKKEVLNRDLWEKLAALIAGKKIKWAYVAGHAGVIGNERCDEIATAFADEIKISVYNGPLAGYGRDILKIAADAGASQKKSDSKSRSKAKAYSYLSLLDGKVMRHLTWEECEKRVKGTSAKFKKATYPQEEKEILSGWGIHG
jgi:ribonuclease HI